MRFQSPEYIAVAMFLSAIGLGANPAQAASEVEPAVAYVEEVSGPVVAFSQGNPTLLDALDVINDRTRLDLLANSELRICHYRTRQLLALKGPLRASVSQGGVTVENSKVVVATAGSCAEPVASTFHGGIVSRSPVVQTITAPRPSGATAAHSR
jgi:hypothetical protein